MPDPSALDRVMAAVDDGAADVVELAAALIRMETVNPPGDAYPDCARLLGARLERAGFEIEYFEPEGRPEHTRTHPRLNVVGLKRGRALRPCIHLNGHLDVVPAGAGWTVDPFGGIVRDGRLYGRGACDMKSGLAAAVGAVEALARAGVALKGSIENSGTVDEESGGFAGVAWLAERGRISAARADHVIIPEPLNPDRICIGHRGVYWFEIAARGRIGHGSMPFFGVNAIEQMSGVIERFQRELMPKLAERITAVPVMPAEARHPTMNINGIAGGQPVGGVQTPCVADVCRAVFDRRFIIEEGFGSTKAEIVDVLARAARAMPGVEFELRDLMIVHPVRTPDDSPLVRALSRSIERVLGRRAVEVASPGTYDHKHFDRIAGIRDCVAYGPGILDVAHQPDEWCGLDDLIAATKVMAAAILELVG